MAANLLADGEKRWEHLSWPALFSVLRKGTKEISGSRVSVKYEEGQDVTDPELRKSPKISVHASGRINVVGDRLLRDSLRAIVEQQELCRALFQHPSHYAPVLKIED